MPECPERIDLRFQSFRARVARKRERHGHTHSASQFAARSGSAHDSRTEDPPRQPASHLIALCDHAGCKFDGGNGHAESETPACEFGRSPGLPRSVPPRRGLLRRRRRCELAPSAPTGDVYDYGPGEWRRS